MLRRMYDWTMSLAGTRHADRALAGVSFIESSFFPIPPDVLLIPMVIKRRDHWFFDYDSDDTEDDEPVHRLGEHRFAVGEYVTVTDEDGRPLTYKVMEVQPA